MGWDFHYAISQNNTLATKAVFKGEWRCGLREGFGVMVYTRDQTYEGEWLRNKRHGWGRMTYSDGSYYEVSWYNMRRSTVITLVLSNDQVKQIFFTWVRCSLGRTLRP